MIQSIAMTPEERQRLEEEMKAQHFHPLVLRLESQAQERRLENDRAYQSTASARNQQTFDTATSRGYHMSRRARERRNWDQLASFFDQGEDMDDMSALETAILYSRLRDERNSEGGSNNSDREQLDGIPLLRTLLTGQLDGNEGSSRSGRSLNLRSSRRQRNQLTRSGLGSFGMRNRGMGDVAIETASMMMRGISEEEQISMAIAASMRDQETADGDDGDEGNDEEESSEVDSSNSENDSPAEDSSDDSGADSSEDSSSSSPPPSIAQSSGEGSQPQLKHQVNGDEASTITELARVVTDTGAPNADTILNGIAA
jgi:hypothetical protein